ncbi:uncharacterized protein [Amphiura filiformis]|uniref:uncharacterized protein n=1 Tax=Amphiura filiformis TaxID=82378 RepID=UPI003B2220E3
MALKSSCRNLQMRNILLIGILLVCCSQTSAEYCPSYTDVFGNYVSGFNCPNIFDDQDEIYCCGFSWDKYCCDNSGNGWGVDADTGFNNEEFDDLTDIWNDAVDGGGTAIALAWWIIVVIVIGILVVIVIPIIIIIICVVRSKASSGGRTTVVSAHNTSDPTRRAATISSTNGMDMTYPTGYN